MSRTAVLHVCDKFGVGGSSIHGVSRLFSWWFPRFSERFAVSLCGLKQPEAASQLLKGAGIPVTHLGRSPFDLRLLGDLTKLAREREAKVLHVHGYAAADYGRVVARRIGAALVLHEHFADPRMPPYQRLADRVLRSYTHRAVAVSGSTADFLVDERSVPRERVRVVWNGAPLAEFAPRGAQARGEYRQRHRISDAAPVVGIVGRLSEQKGHRYFLEAAALVNKERPEVRFLVVGDGELMDEMHDMAARLAISNAVVFAGHEPDVATALAAIDVLAIASLYEGTPLALFEAMASGKTIVSTDVDGCGEILEDGRTALLVPPSDPVRLAAAIHRVLGDSVLADDLAEAASRESARYDVDECVRQLETIYDEALALAASERSA